MRIPTRLGDLDVFLHGDGPPAVFWHSLYVDDRMWDPLAVRLAPDRSFIRITGPCHGASVPRRHRFDIDECAAAALEVLEDLGVRAPVDWVGCAWGGHVGLALAAHRPDRVRTLIAFNTPIERPGHHEAQRARSLIAILRTFGELPSAKTEVLTSLLSDRTRATRPWAETYVARCLRGEDAHALACAARSATLRRPNLRSLAARVTTPTLLVAGDDDGDFTISDAEAAATWMYDAQAVDVPGTRHLTPLEAPEASAALVREHWARMRVGLAA